MSMPAHDRNKHLGGSDALRDVPGFEGVYAVTRDGRVWSHPREWITGQGRVRRHNGIWLRAHPDSSGYPSVIFRLRRKAHYFKVHRLVAITWLGASPSPMHEINHKDGDKMNAADSNLEWVTHSENALHAWATGLSRRTPAMDEHSRESIVLAQAAVRKVTFDEAERIRSLVAGGMKKARAGRIFGLTYWSVRDIVAGKTYRAAA